MSNKENNTHDLSNARRREALTIMRKCTILSSLVAVLGAAALFVSDISNIGEQPVSFESGARVPAELRGEPTPAITEYELPVERPVAAAVHITGEIGERAPEPDILTAPVHGPTRNEADAQSSETPDAGSKSIIAAARAKMSDPVAALARVGGPGLVDLVVSYEEHPELFEASRIESLGGEVVRSFDVLDMRAIRIPAEALEEVAIEDNVDRLSLDDAVSMASVSSRIAANQPLPASGNVAYSGDGVGVAVLDTGISGHADLAADIRQYDFLNGQFPQPVLVNGEISTYNDSSARRSLRSWHTRRRHHHRVGSRFRRSVPRHRRRGETALSARSRRTR